VEPLEPEERKRLVADYLAQSGRELNPKRLGRIATAPQCANPLFLRALLEELTLWGDHDTLDVPIDRYLSATDPKDLYAKILARYEDDYERDRPGLVKDAMSVLWTGRRGLAEAELLDLLGDDGAPLPAAHWSPLYLAADKALVSRSGFIGFFHDYLRRAVEGRYLPDKRAQESAHLRLADYFEARELDRRKVDELPWQLAQARAWERLSALLADPIFLTNAWEHDRFEVKAYWAHVERESQHRLLDAYRPVVDHPRHDRIQIESVAHLLYDTGHRAEALALWKHLTDQARELEDKAGLQVALGNQALILKDRGELDVAMALLKEQERLCRELGDKAGLAASLGSQAPILWDRGQLEAEMALLKEAEQLCRELGDKAALSRVLGIQAGVLWARGELDAAMSLLKEEERLWRELGNKAGLSGCLGSQAAILHERGEPAAAMTLHKEEERVCRELGDKAGLATSLNSQAQILRRRREPAAAITLHKQAERLWRELGDPRGLVISLVNQAAVLTDMRRREALPLAEEAYELAVRNGLLELASQIKSLLDRARVLMGAAQAAKRPLSEDEIRRTLGRLIDPGTD
jgi:hypothetical protein